MDWGGVGGACRRQQNARGKRVERGEYGGDECGIPGEDVSAGRHIQYYEQDPGGGFLIQVAQSRDCNRARGTTL